jgi:hypothetical protein
MQCYVQFQKIQDNTSESMTVLADYPYICIQGTENVTVQYYRLPS